MFYVIAKPIMLFFSFLLQAGKVLDDFPLWSVTLSTHHSLD